MPASACVGKFEQSNPYFHVFLFLGPLVKSLKVTVFDFCFSRTSLDLFFQTEVEPYYFKVPRGRENSLK